MVERRPVIVLRVRPEPRIDMVRSLRAWLKTGSMSFGLRCVDAYQEHDEQEQQQEEDLPMPIDLNDADEQQDRSVIPRGVYALRTKLKAGNAGEDGLLRLAKNGASLMLELECTVVGGPCAGRRLWDMITCDLDEAGLADATPLNGDPSGAERLRTSVRIGRAKLKAILNSAKGLLPSDVSEAAQAQRRFDDYSVFDQLTFYAQVDIKHGDENYKDKNVVEFIVTPDRSDYPKKTPSQAVALKNDMNDKVPF